jgi:hypothetical protein
MSAEDSSVIAVTLSIFEHALDHIWTANSKARSSTPAAFGIQSPVNPSTYLRSQPQHRE